MNETARSFGLAALVFFAWSFYLSLGLDLELFSERMAFGWVFCWGTFLLSQQL